MKNFLKDSWFKIIIAIAILIVAVSAGYYFFVYLPKYQEEGLLEQKNERANNSNFSNQEKCAEDSAKFFDKYMQGSAKNIGDGYNSHYNKSLNKCFIELSQGLGNNSISYVLEDAIEGTEYAEIEFSMIAGEDNPGLCTLYPNGTGDGTDSISKKCVNKSEFDTFVRPYMEN